MLSVLDSINRLSQFFKGNFVHQRRLGDVPVVGHLLPNAAAFFDRDVDRIDAEQVDRSQDKRQYRRVHGKAACVAAHAHAAAVGNLWNQSRSNISADCVQYKVKTGLRQWFLGVSQLVRKNDRGCAQ